MNVGAYPDPTFKKKTDQDSSLKKRPDPDLDLVINTTKKREIKMKALK